MWLIIANGLVYVKYKTLDKTKLMALKCHLFVPRSSLSAMMHIYGTAEERYVVCNCM